MGRIVISMQVSLDGYIAGPNGEFDWPVVGDELLGYFNDEARSADTFCYGRRMYEEMAEFWPTADANPVSTPQMAEYARIWRPVPKVVFSDTLRDAGWNARVVGSAELLAEVERLRAQPGTTHLFYGGADIASTFQRHDLIDEYWLFLHPVVLGGGTRFFADRDGRLPLVRSESRTFPGGVTHLRYSRPAAR